MTASLDTAEPGASARAVPLNPATAPRRRSLVWNRFRRHRLAMLGGSMLLALTLAAIAAPLLVAYEPNAIDLSAYRQAPTSDH